MRLKERKDNWRSHAIVKRDFRHDHSDLIPKLKSYKNRQRWCKGKIGTKHQVTWDEEIWLFGITTYVGKCMNCSKTLYKNHLPRN